MEHTSWRCQANIDVAAWRHNTLQLRDLHADNKVMAVVKADGYGHGLENAVNALYDLVDAFAVASIEEALKVRHLHADSRVCMLSQCWDIEQMRLCQRYAIELVIWQPSHLQWLSSLSTDKPLSVWLKVDTGMGRLGVLPDEVASCLSQLAKMQHIQVRGVMTHFANADDIKDDFTLRQIECFRALSLPVNMPVSLANSAAALGAVYAPALAKVNAQETWLRPGLMLTGTSPFADDTQRTTLNQNVSLKPVMTLKARLLGVRQHKAGSSIGYGGHYITPENMPVGIVAIGYGDGYPRVLHEDAYVMLHGKKASIIGRISMDSLCVDLRHIRQAKSGDEVTLWGDALPIELVAHWAGTIAYELMCQLTPRVTRCLINHNKDKR